MDTLTSRSKKRRLIASLVVLNLAVAVAIQALGSAAPRSAEAGQKPTAPKPVAPISEEERIIQAIARTSPAVVSIVISKEVLSPEVLIFNADGTVTRQEPEKKIEEVGRGTGFLISADGTIATNRHVGGDRQASYDVILSDERHFPARILDIDPVNDLALLKIDADKLPSLTLETDDRLRIGQTVIAIGNALGKYSNTVTRGILSGVERSLEASNELTGVLEQLEDILQTDAAINEGNSGGPLINLDGRVIGVNTAVDRGGEGLGFAIPVSELRKVLASYARYGTVARPRLGVRYLTITPELVLKEKLGQTYGALVRSGSADLPSVLPDGPAARAGVFDGDVILEVNNQKLSGRRTLSKVIQSLSVGDKVVLAVARGSEMLTLTAELDAHPPYK